MIKEVKISLPTLQGLDSFPSVESAYKSYACAPFCIAPQNHCNKKLETHIADRKQFKIVSKTNFGFIVYNF